MDASAANLRKIEKLPDWVPDAVRLYLSHTTSGQSLRSLARERGCHASTVLRQVRRFENRRDDPLVDDALNRLGSMAATHPSCNPDEDHSQMTAHARMPLPRDDEDMLDDDQLRAILERLEAPGAILAIAPDMEKAVVLCDTGDGNPRRTAIMERHIAEAFALKEWITCHRPGRVASYVITAAGRAELARLRGRGRVTICPDGHLLPAAGTEDEDNPRRPRFSGNESPVAALARRRDQSGAPFLTPALVAAAERLREDFELAQMQDGDDTDWEEMLAAAENLSPAPKAAGTATAVARNRVIGALRELGPGLADMALRCCCFLEGLETAERRMGWSARSGKIVLRIALQRLKRHYDNMGQMHQMIG
ncbi:helix-turn-helix domain-containing protein [Rhodobacteraceae bacterium 2376]|uniref:Helix-turn-helix domain-containing protein n=1 Tax=Rhabdonatronobacter sediminivivens TaxID=2743469 RepID=A0A7Z0HZA6_9RHOB|nr:DUF6456 domain-containing protein [Rhabdonatronobacter sediminivivens]NYS25050.1 helix-turn-helix domain-containing protein [Rhabdonatronobacter sediminivivens]